MKQYIDLLTRILQDGTEKRDRTGTGTVSIFGNLLRFNLKRGFPLVTTKKIHFHSILHELIWMLSGDTNIRWLNDHGVKIWDEWADADGNLGPVYGAQWRYWMGVNGVTDQIRMVHRQLRQDPFSRRIMVNSWNVEQLDQMRLPPCHFNFQFEVSSDDEDPGKNKLSCMMNIRSWDVFLGGPFNIAQYALLTLMIANIHRMNPGDLVIASGDTHLYLNHLDQANLQLLRKPFDLPTVQFHTRTAGYDYAWQYKPEDINLVGYNHHPAIKAEVSV